MTRQRGFTILEAVTVVTVLAILIAVAAPALSSMISTQQVRNSALDISASLVAARSEAMTRNASVTVTPAGGNWALGWTVTDEGGAVLRTQSAYARVTMSGPARVIFNGDGRPDSTATPFAIGAADASGESGRCVRVRLNGRPTVAKGGCS